MNCHKCGVGIFKEDIFCWNCGIKLHLVVEFGEECKSKYNSYGSGMYGTRYHAEYKGYIYALMPKAELTGEGFSEGYSSGKNGLQSEKDVIFIRFSIENNKIEILKELRREEYFRNNRRIRVSYDILTYQSVVAFTIYDDKLYYLKEYYDCEENKDYIGIVSLNVNTKQESEQILLMKRNSDDQILGIFKANDHFVYIKSEWNENLGGCDGYIYSLDGTTKKKLGKHFKQIEGYNERYVYYTADEKLYYVDLDTFEITNLTLKISRTKGDAFYGVDARTDTIYLLVILAQKTHLFHYPY